MDRETVVRALSAACAVLIVVVIYFVNRAGDWEDKAKALEQQCNELNSSIAMLQSELDVAKTSLIKWQTEQSDAAAKTEAKRKKVRQVVPPAWADTALPDDAVQLLR